MKKNKTETLKMKVVLASKSPRRRELLSRIFDKFDILAREVDETLPSDVSAKCGVEVLAVRKGAAVLSEVSSDTLVISSDTLVELDGEPLGKPCDEGEAYNMLRKLSGREHNVHTGVAVHYDGKVYSGVDTTSVAFRQLTDEEILAYIATGEPLDKAGSYGIQGLGGALVSGYRGEYETVVGLSMGLLTELLTEAGVI